MPSDISHLKTDMSFPVSYGTGVSVSCSEDKELRGDNVITCNQDTDFKFQIKPKCNDVGMYSDVYECMAIMLTFCLHSLACTITKIRNALHFVGTVLLLNTMR